MPALGEEYVPAGEARSIQIVADACLQMMETDKSPVPRQQHGKGHGVVSALFHVASDVHPELRHGILREPRSYRALIRFSNGRQTDDRKKDAHGLALKLFGVEGPKILDDERDATTQDFIFMDHGTFFIRDAATYAEFAIALQNGTRRARTWFGGHLPAKVQALVIFVHLFRKFLLRHSAERGFIQKVRSDPPVSPLEAHYFSVTPAKLGPHAVRWSLVPRPLATPIPPTPDDAPDRSDRLRAAMAAHLRVHSATFEVFVQRQTNAVTMPVEDPTVAWDELAAPLYRVGTLEVPVQEFDTPHKRAAGDGLSFTNWHSLPEHRPLGGISRVRRAVYQTVAARRRELNGQPLREPDAAWLDEVWDASGTPTAGSLT
jgi:hypothetical protein